MNSNRGKASSTSGAERERFSKRSRPPCPARSYRGRTRLLENEFVLVLDVSIPAGATVPAHLHPWPAVFVTLKPGHLLFRNIAGEVVREARPPIDLPENPQVEWRKPDTEPMVISNVGSSEQRALRIELKFLAR